MMPRHEATAGRGVPLYLVPHLVMRALFAHGGETDRTGANRFSRHVFTVGARTTPVRREFRRSPQAGPGAAAGLVDPDAGTEQSPAVSGHAGTEGDMALLSDGNAGRRNTPATAGDAGGAGEIPGPGDREASTEKIPVVGGGPGACGAMPGPANPGPGQIIVPVTAGNARTGEEITGLAGRRARQEGLPGPAGMAGDPGDPVRFFDGNAGQRNFPAGTGESGGAGPGDRDFSPEKVPAVAGWPGAFGEMPVLADPGPGHIIVPVTAGNVRTGEDITGLAGREARQEGLPGPAGMAGDPGGTYRLFDGNAGRKRSPAPPGGTRESLP